MRKRKLGANICFQNKLKKMELNLNEVKVADSAFQEYNKIYTSESGVRNLERGNLKTFQKSIKSSNHK